MKLLSTHRMQRGILILIIGLCTAFAGCNKASTAEQITELEAKFKEATTAEGDKIKTEEIRTLMSELAVLYEKNAGEVEDKDASADYLYKAAEMYETNQLDVGKAIGIYETIYKEHPDHKRAADALFKMGYIYHNILNDLPKAEQTYKTFLDKYPNDELAPSAQFEVDNLGVSPEEILNRLRPDSLQGADTTAANTP